MSRVHTASTSWWLAAVLAAAPLEAGSGVVVDVVRPGTSAAAAGMEPGDRILALDGVPVADTLAWHEVRWERAPRGGAELSGLRGESPRTWTLAPGPWGIEVLALDGSDALGARYLAALEQLGAGRSEAAAGAASEVADELDAAGRPRTAAAVRLDFARRLGAGRALAAADRIAVEAVARLDAGGRELEAAFARLELGMRRQLREDWVAAAVPLGEAETALRALAPRSLRLGRVVCMLGFSAARLGDFAVATKRYEEAERLCRELAPDNLELADIYTSQGARTVVATLWSVGDRSSADLMDRFHVHLSAGQPPAGALRAAQLEILRGDAGGVGGNGAGAARGVGGLAPSHGETRPSPAGRAGFVVSGASD